jgi:hypothetical protein
LGIEVPRVRQDYEAALADFLREVEQRRATGASRETLARWAVEERAAIARRIRSQQGFAARALYEVRDVAQYGRGGRNYTNMVSRYARRGYAGDALHEALLRGATHPNTGISDAAIRGARYLRYGGRVVVVLSIATTGYVLLTTPADQLERVVYEEAGAAGLGAAGTAAAVGLCLVFGVATGGLGLLACGALGGVAGGALGSYAGNRLYYTTRSASDTAEQTGVLASDELSERPELACY